MHRGGLLKPSSSLSFYQTQALLVYGPHFYSPSLSQVPQLCWPLAGPSPEDSHGDNGNNHFRGRFMLRVHYWSKAVCQQYTGAPLQFFRAVLSPQIPFPFLLPSSCSCVSILSSLGKACCVSKGDNLARFLPAVFLASR